MEIVLNKSYVLVMIFILLSLENEFFLYQIIYLNLLVVNKYFTDILIRSM